MYRKAIKRILDICLSVIGLPFLLLGIIFIAPMIFLDDPGPIFYNAERLGKNGKIFNMYKFRTMKVHAPDLRNEDGSTFNAKDDPRLTQAGRILRKTSLDEIPQLLNVLKGDMSLVGPRPDLPEHRTMYEGEEEKKLLVRPGITGFSQAYYRNSIPWKKRLENDVYYVKHMSFLLDVKIFFKTILSVFASKGVYIESSDKIEEGRK